MEQSPSSERHRHCVSQEIIRLIRNPNVQYLIPNSPQLVPVPSQLNPLHTLALRFILILFCRLCKGLRRYVHISFFSGLVCAKCL
jgi:hypothetical protein